jgi:hypothetical protein
MVHQRMKLKEVEIQEVKKGASHVYQDTSVDPGKGGLCGPPDGYGRFASFDKANNAQVKH